MFATLLGGLPRPPGADAADVTGADAADAAAADPERLIETAVRAQEAAGLEPVTDGRLRDPQFERLERGLIALVTGGRESEGDVVDIADDWRATSAMTDRAVKQALPGPYSVGRRAVDAGLGAAGRNAAGLDAAAVTLGVAAVLREVIEDLAAAGCPLVEIEESDAHRIGADEAERELFREAHRRLTDSVVATHLSLSIVGGSAWDAGLETIASAGYASLAVDLVAGPDNWNLVTRLPGKRGVIVGALPAKDSPADAREVLLWAARYAARSSGRGADRVGIGSAGSFASLTWEAAVRKMERLGEAARLASMGGGENLARELDPRAVSARAAALGHVPPRTPRRRAGGR